MTEHDDTTTGELAGAAVGDRSNAARLVAAALGPTTDTDADRDERATALRLLKRDRGSLLAMSPELRTAVESIYGRWWAALTAAHRPAVAAVLVELLVAAVLRALAEVVAPAQAPDARSGTSDHHPDPRPADPLAAARTLVAAPGAPSLRGRAAAA